MTTIRQIQTTEQIKAHFLLAYHVQPAMTVCFDSTVTSEVNRLMLNSKGPDEIVLKIISPHLPKATDVSVKYMLDGFEHHFVSRIIDVKPLGNAGSFLKIRLPTVIRAVNRRNSVRINPSGRESVQVALFLSDRAPASCLVIDISMGGFALIVPSSDPIISYQDEIKGELHLPDHTILPTMVKIRNMIQQQDRYRIGMEFSSMSKDTLKKLMDYIVGHTVKNRDIQSSAPAKQQPHLCLIHDNQRYGDTLNYLEPFYHLVRQDIRADLKPMIQMIPDVLLFNLDTIRPHTLIPKIRTLTNMKKTPAIVINEDDAMDACMDATILSQFKDPAALIEAVEHSIGSDGNLPNGSPISLTRRNKPLACQWYE
jgi:c-di-GMP-binding flagellar brake protein YcgR